MVNIFIEYKFNVFPRKLSKSKYAFDHGKCFRKKQYDKLTDLGSEPGHFVFECSVKWGAGDKESLSGNHNHDAFDITTCIDNLCGNEWYTKISKKYDEIVTYSMEGEGSGNPDVESEITAYV